MKKLVAAIALLILTGNANAKVACAPDVNSPVCKDANKVAYLNSFLDHSLFPGMDIPVEIVTAKEYAKRLSDMEDDEARSANLYPGGLNAIADCKTCFSPLRKHTLTSAVPNVSFLRDEAQSSLVSRILVSSAFFEGVSIPIQGGPDVTYNGGAGVYYPPSIDKFEALVSGYLSGTMSTMWDNSVSMEFMQKHFPKQPSK